jgi:Ca2+-binding RTX toxin-like protein
VDLSNLQESVVWGRKEHLVSAHVRFLALPVAAAALALPAAALAVTEPGGGSNFNTGAQGWSPTAASCQPEGGLVGEECDAVNTADGSALRSRLTVTTGLVRFGSEFAWRSPTFFVGGDPGAIVDGADFSFDRRFNSIGVSGLDPEATIEVAIVDETTGADTQVAEESVDADDGTFETRSDSLPPGAVTRNDFHHIELRASVATTTTLGGTTGSADVLFDNVSLSIPDPPGNSPGVRFVAPPKTNPAIRALMNGTDVHALSGNGSGGSIVSRSQCTITGTSGADRITATTGNDVICGFGGNDKISGRPGRDVIDAGDGDDRATGAGGGDLLLGLDGKDRLVGRRGKDRIGGGDDKDKLYGQGNKDFIGASDNARDLVHGGAGHRDRARVDGRKGKGRADRLRKIELVTQR